MNNQSNGRKRLAWLALAVMVTVGLWWIAAHSDNVQPQAARRIIVYSTTS